MPNDQVALSWLYFKVIIHLIIIIILRNNLFSKIKGKGIEEKEDNVLHDSLNQRQVFIYYGCKILTIIHKLLINNMPAFNTKTLYLTNDTIHASFQY